MGKKEEEKQEEDVEQQQIPRMAEVNINSSGTVIGIGSYQDDKFVYGTIDQAIILYNELAVLLKTLDDARNKAQQEEEVKQVPKPTSN